MTTTNPIWQQAIEAGPIAQLRDNILMAEKNGYDLRIGLDRIAEYAEAFRALSPPEPTQDGLVELLKEARAKLGQLDCSAAFLSRIDTALSERGSL